MNAYIDHTLLSADASKEEIIKLCNQAIEYNFPTVCVPSYYVETAYAMLRETPVKVCTVVGFPLGNCNTIAKVEEAKKAIEDGAEEIDMVINQAAIKSKNWHDVKNDISQVKVVIGHYTLKVILEICNLTDEEIVKTCKIAEKAGANFVKTSTGFAKSGASIHAVKLMKQSVSSKVFIKASGGIRDAATAQQYINLGVFRIGTSSGLAIVDGTTSSNLTY